jgi:hypothetical protein
MREKDDLESSLRRLDDIARAMNGLEGLQWSLEQARNDERTREFYLGRYEDYLARLRTLSADTDIPEAYEGWLDKYLRRNGV